MGWACMHGLPCSVTCLFFQMGFGSLGLGITNQKIGLRFGPNIGREMGFEQNVGWEMRFFFPPPPCPFKILKRVIQSTILKTFNILQV